MFFTSFVGFSFHVSLQRLKIYTCYFIKTIFGACLKLALNLKWISFYFKKNITRLILKHVGVYAWSSFCRSNYYFYKHVFPANSVNTKNNVTMSTGFKFFNFTHCSGFLLRFKGYNIALFKVFSQCCEAQKNVRNIGYELVLPNKWSKRNTKKYVCQYFGVCFIFLHSTSVENWKKYVIVKITELP